jgi:hypothetical protein
VDTKDVKQLERRTMRDVALIVAGVILGLAIHEILSSGFDLGSSLLLLTSLFLLVAAIRMKR